MEYLTHLIYRLLYARGSGYKKSKPDVRDFDTFDIGWGFGYTPKYKRVEFETLSVKNQSPYNTCVYNSTTVCKEIDENVVLSVRSLVVMAKRLGLMIRDGWSNLNAGEKVLKAWGIQEERDLPDLKQANFDSYSKTVLDNQKASKHKIKSYWTVNSRDQRLKALDEGKAIKVAIDWYTGFNSRYLTRYFPDYIIMKAVGYKVGGHALAMIGYDLDKNIYIIQNSYGTTYGTKTDTNTKGGIFYIDMDYFDKNNHGAYVNLDMGIDSGAFIKAYAQKNVKGNSSAIYYISGGKKHVYPNWFTYLCFTENKKGFIQLSEAENEVLDKMTEGEPMKAEKSNFFAQNKNKLKDLATPENLDKILEILNKI